MLINYFSWYSEGKTKKCLPLNSTKMHILQASPPITIHSNLKEQIQEKNPALKATVERRRGRWRREGEREGHTSALGADRIILLLLFILSVSSVGPDLEQDRKILSILYILYVGVLVLLLFWGLGLYLFVEFFLVGNCLMGSPQLSTKQQFRWK